MNDVPGWIEKKLQEHGYSSTRLSSFQIEIARVSSQPARVLCIGLAAGEKFDAEDIDSCMEKVPDTDYIVVVPTRIAHRAYERAEECGICVSGFGELVDALDHDDNIAEHVDSQEQYERRRLVHHGAVTSVKRKGQHAYEIRRGKLPPLTIVTTNTYEFTADELYTLLESYDGVHPDLVVVTNPNCRGFSTDSRRASRRAGIPIILFERFLQELGTGWT